MLVIDNSVPAESTTSANMVAKAEGVLAEIDVALAVFLQVDPALTIRVLIKGRCNSNYRARSECHR